MDTVEQFKNETWQLHPSLDFEELYPPAVLFSIFEYDPRPKFKDRLKKVQEQMEKRVPASTAADFQDARQARLSTSWDWVFHEIPGDQISFLLPTRGQRSAGRLSHAEEQLRTQIHAVIIASNSVPGIKWLVTRATRYKQRPVCWCLPVNVEKGKVSEVSLSRQNMTELETL